MKFLLTAIASISLIILAGSANALPVNPTPQIAPPISQSENDREQILLAKAIINFFHSDRYLTKSESLLKVNSAKGGLDVTAKTYTKTIVQSGGKFRSEITFTKPDGSKGITSLIVSNGKQVWIYRPDLKKYKVTSYTKFQESQEEFFLVGMSSLIFLSIDQPTRAQIGKANAFKTILDELKMEQGKSISNRLDRRVKKSMRSYQENRKGEFEAYNYYP